jgi:cathepsin L
LTFAIVLVGTSAIPLQSITRDDEDLWQRFKLTFKKSYYDDNDEMYRKAVFLHNNRMIVRHNTEESTGRHTYKLAMNEFGDLTFEEFHFMYTGYRRPMLLRAKGYVDLSEEVADVAVDWQVMGAVTPVKNQGQCGSCWAFSTTGAVEGAWFISNKTLISMSEQELMDCSKDLGNDSCEGGLMDYAFEYILHHGICSESSYPYKMADRKSCDSCSPVAQISSYTDINQTDADLAKAVTRQPVSVAIEADEEAFQFYSSGVLTGDCGTQLDHGVLAVGYGELNGTQYWKVKNSWGAGWGQGGYILIQRGKAQEGGQCGILLAASFPTV